ncbi:SAS2 [[Candida] subhashii]|uniref:SAS2 n=1 Tax=[Candida] subhashii TaxID=561895 RepID=A0A8J5QN70_9ASCO|nr:SAS2 [[Candida] subhashii]KAG7663428.1 SAS2 [[Candida] subhashii]
MSCTTTTSSASTTATDTSVTTTTTTMPNDQPSSGKSTSRKKKNIISKENNSYYGLLSSPNIKRVTLGKYEFETWYGNAAYFNPNDVAHTCLGYEYSNKVAQDPSLRKLFRSSSVNNNNNNSNNNNNLTSQQGENGFQYWLDHLYVCEYCFKYTTNEQELSQHVQLCKYNKPRPTIGKLLYRDDISGPYMIREIQGFKNTLFCQNLCLFGKLFLDDKSVYYSIDHFNFYVLYGYDLSDEYPRNFKPMGFFSKEVLSYDNDNNLACICVFPSYQRRRLGSLLIEFSYALARVTPGQYRSGPEFPLSPYGKVTYLRFWSKKLAYLILQKKKLQQEITLVELSNETGFRKEDILYTLEYTQCLHFDSNNDVQLSLPNLEKWCLENSINPSRDIPLLKQECLVI